MALEIYLKKKKKPFRKDVKAWASHRSQDQWDIVIKILSLMLRVEKNNLIGSDRVLSMD